ncbi:diaminopropionate ammonia-lyase [Marinobacter sp. ELB17]|nr:diaminopropionate ammonia-lyase [Marinobacter sp. ELB17]
MGWHRSLDQGFALFAGPLASDTALHRELAGDVIQFFADVFPHPLKLAAAATLDVLRLVADQAAGKFRR